MKKLLFVMVCFLPLTIYAQSDYLRIIDKYGVNLSYCSLFTSHSMFDYYLGYKAVDALLSNKDIQKVVVQMDNNYTKVYDSNGMTYRYKKDVPKPDSTILKTYDSKNRLLTVNDGRYIETFKYDSIGNLIELLKYPAPKSYKLICLDSAHKWNGFYDSNNRLIKDVSTWDNEKTYTAEYHYESDTLRYVEFETFDNGKIRKEYIYKSGLIEEIVIYHNKRLVNDKIKFRRKILYNE